MACISILITLAGVSFRWQMNHFLQRTYDYSPIYYFFLSNFDASKHVNDDEMML